jgi:hypothetical protein
MEGLVGIDAVAEEDIVAVVAVVGIAVAVVVPAQEGAAAVAEEGTVVVAVVVGAGIVAVVAAVFGGMMSTGTAVGSGRE